MQFNRQRSFINDRPLQEADGKSSAGGAAGAAAGHSSRRPQQQHWQHAESFSNERTDALWAEMQNTLEEVELSAISGTHVFGPSHSKALDELRTAQIELARAWARSGAEGETRDQSKQEQEQDKLLGTADILASERGKAAGRPRSGTNGTTTSQKSQLEQETENDILLARKRREANDKYFQKVNTGVLDVVAKLEEVAKAMKGVEQESKEIWGDKESLETGSSP